MDNMVICKVVHLVMWLVLQGNRVNCTQYHKVPQFCQEDKVEESRFLVGILVCDYYCSCSKDDDMFCMVWTNLNLLMNPIQHLQMLQLLQLPSYSFQMMEEWQGSNWQGEDSWEDCWLPRVDWKDNLEDVVYCSKDWLYIDYFQYFQSLYNINFTFFVQYDLLNLDVNICTHGYSYLKSFKVYFFKINTLHSQLITFPHLSAQTIYYSISQRKYSSLCLNIFTERDLDPRLLERLKPPIFRC